MSVSPVHRASVWPLAVPKTFLARPLSKWGYYGFAALVWLTAIAVSLPRGLIGVPTIGGVSWWNLFYVLLVLYAGVIGLSRAERKDILKVTLLTSLVVLPALVKGLLKSDSELFNYRTLIDDLLSFVALPVGLLFASSVQHIQIHRVLRVALMILACLLALGMLLLTLGAIAQVRDSERSYDPSFFTPSFLCSLLGVYIWWTRGDARFRGAALLSIGAVSVSTAFALLSATRSDFITAALAVLAMLWWYRDRMWFWMVFMIILCGIFLTLLFGGNLDASILGNLGERFAGTSIKDEWRFSELMAAYYEFKESWLFGFGLGTVLIWYHAGVSFVSTDLHVSIATFLLKGGLLAGAVVACIFAYSVKGFFAGGTHLLHKAGCAAVLVYVARASLSGGYDVFILFIVGLMLGVSRGVTVRRR